jgi:hypothetical protein
VKFVPDSPKLGSPKATPVSPDSAHAEMPPTLSCPSDATTPDAPHGRLPHLPVHSQGFSPSQRFTRPEASRPYLVPFTPMGFWPTRILASVKPSRSFQPLKACRNALFLAIQNLPTRPVESSRTFPLVRECRNSLVQAFQILPFQRCRIFQVLLAFKACRNALRPPFRLFQLDGSIREGELKANRNSLLTHQLALPFDSPRR